MSFADPEAYGYDGDIICPVCYAQLTRKQRRQAWPAVYASEVESEPGAGVSCGWCHEVLQETTDEYLFRKLCREQHIIGLRLATEEHEIECIECVVRWRDYEPEHERLPENMATGLTCWDCGKPLVSDYARCPRCGYPRENLASVYCLACCDQVEREQGMKG